MEPTRRGSRKSGLQQNVSSTSFPEMTIDNLSEYSKRLRQISKQPTPQIAVLSEVKDPTSQSRKTDGRGEQREDVLSQNESYSQNTSEISNCLKILDLATLSDENDDTKSTKKRHPNHRNPAVCDWYKRPYLQADIDPTITSPFVATLAPIPANSLGNVIIKDILAILSGNQSNYIVVKPSDGEFDPRHFTISDCIDSSICKLIRDILPIASYYSTVKKFIHKQSNNKYGKVNNTLCYGMDHSIHEYLVHVGRLEEFFNSNALSLQSLLYYIQPIMCYMKILADIATQISKTNAIGGKTLSLLHKLTASNWSHPTGYVVCLYLIQEASVPYMKMLEQWVFKGLIEDNYREFLVDDNEIVEKDMLTIDFSTDYWENRYTICTDRVPVFLERVAKVILRTGKYLNVIRLCGVNVKFPQSAAIVYKATESHYVDSIDKAYSFASQTLLDLLLKDYDLIGRLRSVKHYFLLDQGDFIVQLMDSCDAELCKNIDDIIPTSLESLFELVLRTSAANSDPYKDDIKTELMNEDIFHQMAKILNQGFGKDEQQESWQPSMQQKDFTGIKSFTFTYQVKWPVSLILNKRSLISYQLIFRHLFYCKHVERSLSKIWLNDKVAKSFSRAASSSYSAAFTLRQRMLNCIQNLEYYMMVEVIEPNWLVFLDKMSKVRNIDDVLEYHHDFLETCLKDCMLTMFSPMSTVSDMMSVCMRFSQFIQSPEPPVEEGSGDGHTYQENITLYDLEFTSLLVRLIRQIQDLCDRSSNDKLASVLYRLDFNGFYAAKMEQLTQSDCSFSASLKAETSG